MTAPGPVDGADCAQTIYIPCIGRGQRVAAETARLGVVQRIPGGSQIPAFSSWSGRGGLWRIERGRGVLLGSGVDFRMCLGRGQALVGRGGGLVRILWGAMQSVPRRGVRTLGVRARHDGHMSPTHVTEAW